MLVFLCEQCECVFDGDGGVGLEVDVEPLWFGYDEFDEFEEDVDAVFGFEHCVVFGDGGQELVGEVVDDVACEGGCLVGGSFLSASCFLSFHVKSKYLKVFCKVKGVSLRCCFMCLPLTIED